MPKKCTASLKKLNEKQVDALKGKLVKVKRAGAHPIYVEVTEKDSIGTCLVKADIPTQDVEIKIEAMKEKEKTWKVVKLTDKAFKFAEICVTTKVRGSF